MAMRRWAAITALGGLVAGLIGCDRQFPNQFPASIQEVDQIVKDTDLTPQEKRERLESLGLTPAVINALLRDDETGNQYGGDLTSAFAKIVQGRLNELTPDEVQIYAEAARETPGGPTVTFSDAQAQLVVDLFVDNGLRTLAQVGAFLSNTSNELPKDLTRDSLTRLFVDFDPNNVRGQLP
jgi:hypothetical protein